MKHNNEEAELQASMNVVNDAEQQNFMRPNFFDTGQDMIGKLSFDDRDAAFDFGTFPIKDFRKISAKAPKGWIVLPACGLPAADTNRGLGFQTIPDVTMVGQRIESFVYGQSFDANPSRFLFGNRFEFPCIACGSPAGVLSENQQNFVFDKNRVFDKPSMLSLAPLFQAFSLTPKTAKGMRPSVGQSITCAVAERIALASQSLFQVLEKISKQIFDDLPAKTSVKLLQRRMIRTVQQSQKLPEPRIAQCLFFGFAIGPFVSPSQKKQSQMPTLPLSLLGKLVRIIFNRFPEKLNAYQNKLLVACQWFHEKLLLSQVVFSRGSFSS